MLLKLKFQLKTYLILENIYMDCFNIKKPAKLNRCNYTIIINYSPESTLSELWKTYLPPNKAERTVLSKQDFRLSFYTINVLIISGKVLLCDFNMKISNSSVIKNLFFSVNQETN